MLPVIQPDFEITAQHVKKLFAFMGIRFPTAPAGFDAEKVGLHGRIAPSQKLHANAGRGFKDFALLGANEALGLTVGFKERKNTGLVEAGDSAERCYGGVHLTTLERAEEADGDTGGAGDLSERKATARAQTAKPLPGMLQRIGGGADYSLVL